MTADLVDAAQMVAEMGWEPVENPLEAVADLAGEILAHKEVMRAQVAALVSLTVTDQLGREDASALLLAYERSLDRSEKILVDLSKLGLEERRTRVTERQHRLMVQVIERVLAQTGLDPKVIEVRSRVAEAIEALEVAT
jgi:hypothetical protein